MQGELVEDDAARSVVAVDEEPPGGAVEVGESRRAQVGFAERVDGDERGRQAGKGGGRLVE